ncbi:uncharacterized protein DUF397 [Streptomyces sp. SLBN-118]|uniref:DUF397 domain-containing protein n=1 Tax=Streptomyces sp. SLBN-118 TaxID=2768454 RepID=UPI00114E4DDF|nr:DUF397 domain-containing protein [Streptomyces sp. SLBN-118]TQK50875.1 uncharacterized protein DUF397 [Streptomyces sp. SLBN-118]
MSTNDELNWFKSSHSGSQGDSCVEVALHWYKSSHSGSEGDDCVEVACRPDAVHVRDSKAKDGPRLAVSQAAWVEFIEFAGV